MVSFTVSLVSFKNVYFPSNICFFGRYFSFSVTTFFNIKISFLFEVSFSEALLKKEVFPVSFGSYYKIKLYLDFSSSFRFLRFSNVVEKPIVLFKSFFKLVASTCPFSKASIQSSYSFFIAPSKFLYD